ncbi:MAG: BamA/TamA family outer membrane protein [Bacteroidota bacterium]
MIKSWRKYLFILIFIPQIISAQFYFFGRNKVQYEKFNWKVIHTEHFNIYYYDDFTELAEIGARYAEESYDILKVKFNFYVINKIPLIFYNTHTHFEQTNVTTSFIPEGVGGFFEFMKGRVVIPYMGSLGQFKHVIRHELVHVFMTSKLYNVLYDHRVSTERTPPLWFTEGLAEYWSTDWDTQSEMVMRDAVLNGQFVSLVNLDMISGSYLMYKEGQRLLGFISQEYGEDKILAIMENYWRFSKFDDDLEFTLGSKLEDVDNKWIYKIRQEYYPLYKNNYPHFVEGKKLTDFGFNFSPRILERNGKKEIYFVGNYYGYTSLMKMPYAPDTLETVKPEVVVQGEKDAIFEAFHLLENSIAVSSNGYVAFVTGSQGRDVLHLYSVDEDEVVKNIGFNELIRMKSPSFSKDGNEIVFNGTDKKGFSDLYSYNLKTEELQRLTDDYYDDIDPAFNLDGTKIIFASDRTDGIFKKKYNLFQMDLRTKEITYLTNVDANISTPHFSPDYKNIFFTSDYDGVYNIWEMPYCSEPAQGMKQITRFITSVYDFDFADPHTLVTSGFEMFSFQFYSIDLDKNILPEQKFVTFKLDDIGSKWLADRISLGSEKEGVKYQKEYTLDYAVSQLITDPVYGTRGGAILTLSDLLGDDRYIFYIFNNAEVQSEILKNFNVAISRVNLKGRSNYGYGVFQYAGRRYDIRDSDEYFYERAFGGYFSLFYPLSTFQRIEAEVDVANSDKQLLGDITTRRALLVSNSLSFVSDNAIWFATGPIDGSRFRVLIGYTNDVKYSNVNYYSLIVDYRKYFRLGLRTSLATRAAFFINDGKEARRYFAGGSWDLRGWDRWSIRGEKLWLSSVELRFPLIDRLSINFPFLGLTFFQIRGAAYFDAGSAWDTQYKETLGSLGVGIRINFFNAIALRYDIGKKIEKNFTQFQPKLFYQFFFGWDF